MHGKRNRATNFRAPANANGVVVMDTTGLFEHVRLGHVRITIQVN